MVDLQVNFSIIIFFQIFYSETVQWEKKHSVKNGINTHALSE